MEANINSLLDKAEDPEKMIDEALRDMQDDLNEVKSETATIMAEQMRAQREFDENQAEVNKLQSYAERAVAAGNDSDARDFLTKKSHLVGQQASLQQVLVSATANSTKMRAMHDKLVDQIGELDSRRDNIKAKMNIAKTQEHINKLGSSIDQSKGSMNKFGEMEEKANKMLDKANAMAELNSVTDNELSYEEKLDDLEDKYDDIPSAPSVEDELAAMKAKAKK